MLFWPLLYVTVIVSPETSESLVKFLLSYVVTCGTFQKFLSTAFRRLLIFSHSVNNIRSTWFLSVTSTTLTDPSSIYYITPWDHRHLLFSSSPAWIICIGPVHTHTKTNRRFASHPQVRYFIVLFVLVGGRRGDCKYVFTPCLLFLIQMAPPTSSREIIYCLYSPVFRVARLFTTMEQPLLGTITFSGK